MVCIGNLGKGQLPLQLVDGPVSQQLTKLGSGKIVLAEHNEYLSVERTQRTDHFGDVALTAGFAGAGSRIAAWSDNHKKFTGEVGYRCPNANTAVQKRLPEIPLT